MHRYLLSILLLFAISAQSIAQIWKGRVVCAETDEPIPYANVFLRASLIGTTSNVDGYFELDPKEFKGLSLVVSSLAYKSVEVQPDMLGKKLKIALNRQNYEIGEVEVSGKGSSWSRRRMIRKFKLEFVGQTRVAKSCEILNIDDVYLYYNKGTKTLHAHSKSPIIIRNKALGYKVSYDLLQFKWTRETLKFKGYPGFQELIFSGAEEKEKIYKQRQLAYLGTPMHFFRTLYAGSMEGTRYDMYDNTIKTLRRDDLLVPDEDGLSLCRKEAVIVRYAGYLRSEIRFLAPCIKLNEYGFVEADDVTYLGTMGIYRVGDMLPYDYVPEK